MAFICCTPKKSGASPLPLPLLHFAHSERKQKQNKKLHLQHSAGGTVIPQGKPDISSYCLRHHQEPLASERVTKTGILPRRLMRCLRRILPAMQHRLFVRNVGGRTLATHLYCPPLEQHIPFVFHPAMPASTFPVIAALSDAP